MAKLIVISGEERQEFELAAFNTIGRHPDNTIQILIIDGHRTDHRSKDLLLHHPHVRVEEGWSVMTAPLPPHRPHRAQLTQWVRQPE